MNKQVDKGRRSFIKKSSLGVGALALGSSFANAESSESTETKKSYQGKKFGVAIVGLSWFSKGHVATSFVDSEYCKLVGFVTGRPEKAKDFQKQYNIPDKNIYSYDSFDEIAKNPDIDIVHIVLPNALHSEYTIRAAKAGKHVICEKPMDVNVEKSQAMIKACKDAGVLLQIGYRCQYDPYHLELKRLTKEKAFGEVKILEMGFAFFGVHGSNWRFTNKDLAGGGPMMDLGCYCIQSARFIMGADPIAVTGRTYKTYEDKMPDMEETIMWEMEFQNGAVARCFCQLCGE